MYSQLLKLYKKVQDAADQAYAESKNENSSESARQIAKAKAETLYAVSVMIEHADEL
jgi:hypothetical protein